MKAHVQLLQRDQKYSFINLFEENKSRYLSKIGV